MLMNRIAVLEAMELLERSGREIKGDENSWHIALGSLSDVQIKTASFRVIESHRFNTVKASDVFNASSKGRGGENDPTIHSTHLGGLVDDSWERWKDNEGREYAFHPSMARFALNKETHKNILRAEAEAERSE